MKAQTYIKNALFDLGLTEGEAFVYLLMLKSPGADVSYVKSKTKFSNAGVYKILNSLVEKGFAECGSGIRPSLYFALPLNKIAKKFENQGRRLERIAERFKRFENLGKNTDVSEVYEDTSLTDYYLDIPYKITDGFIWCAGSFEAVKTFLGIDAEKEFINNRVKKGIQCDAIIFDESDESKKIAGTDKGAKRETRFISGYNYPLEFTYVFEDSVVTFYKDSDNKVKILKTHSPDFAKSRLLQYQMLWKSTCQ